MESDPCRAWLRNVSRFAESKESGIQFSTLKLDSKRTRRGEERGDHQPRSIVYNEASNWHSCNVPYIQY
jgi:hypothetical protein